ncbi:MAG: sigma-54-dependent Fis family transcriptional regulator [Deltaproteobacteria bacterium]|nr:sigma-54-dependent Fis family transcriptional regulator [Deltaproteobacteria bacterium]
MTRILVIDDQASTLELLRKLFVKEGYEVDVMSDGEQAREQLQGTEYDVVFTDLRLGYPYDGLEVLEMVKSIQPRAQVVIMTAFSSVESSVLAMRGGAYDYITKPFKGEEVLLLAERASEKAHLAEQVRSLEQKLEGQVPEPDGPTQIVGSSPAMMQMMRLVTQVARTDATALVIGDSGTGKELVARAIHQLSPRKNGPFVAVNCGAIPETLQESEFFGHAKGAFTGAIRTKMGLFEQASKGTLFLDEVGETSLATQVKLLRFLQEGEVRKVGETRSVNVDVRLVAATNRDLVDMIEEGSFREDLYYRLNIVAVEVPPLRDRDGDLELLASFFLQRYSRKLKSEVKVFSEEAMRALKAHHWPGNVRELENAVERAVTLARGPILHREDLPSFDRGPRRAEESTTGSWSTTPSGGWLAQPAPRPRPRVSWDSERQPNPARSDDPAAMFGRSASPAVGPREVGESRGPAVWRPLTGPGAVGGGPFNRELEQARFPSIEEMERRHIEAALHLFKGSRTEAGKALGISKATLWRKIKRFGLESVGRDQS